MGVATGCGCKEVYRFPHTTYPYSSCICSFSQQHPYFLFIFLMFFVLVYCQSEIFVVKIFLCDYENKTQNIYIQFKYFRSMALPSKKL